MFKLVFEKAEEPEIKLPTSNGSSKNQKSSRKTSTSALLTTPKPLTVWITINWQILQEMGITDHLTCLLRNLYAGQEATVRTRHGKSKPQWGTISHQSEWLWSKSLQTINAGEGVEKREPSYTVLHSGCTSLHSHQQTPLCWPNPYRPTRSRGNTNPQYRKLKFA